jgi:hypothetical protein
MRQLNIDRGGPVEGEVHEDFDQIGIRIFKGKSWRVWKTIFFSSPHGPGRPCWNRGCHGGDLRVRGPGGWNRANRFRSHLGGQPV